MTIIPGDFGRRAKKGKKNGKTIEKKAAFLYQFHVSLAFSDPLIWRRVQVPGEINLQQFHEVLRICMGWSGQHDHKFYVGKIFYEMSSPAGIDKEYDEVKFELQTLEEAMKWCFTYLYDVGEGWEHDIIIEGIKPQQKAGKKYPVLLDGQWASPPEEIGGVHSYSDFLQALKNPTEEKNERLLRFHDSDDFDPEYFDQNVINDKLVKTFILDG